MNFAGARPGPCRALPSLCCAFACATILTLAGATTQGQSQAEPLRNATLDHVIPFDLLEDLPSSDNLPSLLGAVVPEFIPDRLDTGGVSTGEAARLGAHGSTWTQTQYRLGDVDITDPDGSGTPLFVPGVLDWQHVAVTTGLKPADLNAPGPIVHLVPHEPSRAWVRRFEGSVGPSAFGADAKTSPPAIQRLDSWKHAHLFASGPLADRLGVAVSGSWMEASRFDRSDPTRAVGDQASFFAHLVYAPRPRTALRTLLYGQRATVPAPYRVVWDQPSAAERDRAWHVQSTWEQLDGARDWRVFGAYTSRTRESEIQLTTPIVIERLTDGPVSELLYPGAGTAPAGVDRRFTGGARAALRPFTLLGRGHATTIGVDFDGTQVRAGDRFAARIGELVAGIPARVWDYTGWRTLSRWTGSTLALHAGDQVDVSERLHLSGGLRFEWVAGDSAGAARGVSWHDLYPRVAARWDPTGSRRLSLFSGYSRYGSVLPLRWLSVGDPAAPVASVYRWLPMGGARPPQPADIGPLVARVGPGTDGDPRFTGIEPGLERPRVDEVVVGVESRHWSRTLIRLAGIGRWENQNVALTNPAVPDTSYSIIYVPDGGVAGLDLLLPAYNRDPSSFGSDRYLLTNPSQNSAKALGLDLTVVRRTERLFLFAGGTAGYFDGVPANRGFYLTENDRGLVGETFTNPNARTHSANSRPFTDRGYTLKISGVYQFPQDMRLGAIARYQDGQPFSRMVVFPQLNQGAEAVRAFENGGTRFQFTLTLDARLQKRIDVGRTAIDIVFDGYNLLNKGDEIEESQIDGPTWRQITAVQPPLALHFGVRVTF